ncbi:MAG: hypothetical protein KF757_09850 [Phycisphaeraceae bacterium]|nr:hypothetical protein [Phycisphaeraceae bacterium]MCW5763515.1 hypothetical protein [Phycisphaeraceae bacterium]
MILLCALLVGVIVLGKWGSPNTVPESTPVPNSLRTPGVVGPALGEPGDPIDVPVEEPMIDDEPDLWDDEGDLPAPEETAAPVLERDFDITLLEWSDAHAHLLATTDESAMASVSRAIEMLRQYEAARGLPDQGHALLNAYVARLEQLRLGGMP